MIVFTMHNVEKECYVRRSLGLRSELGFNLSVFTGSCLGALVSCDEGALEAHLAR
jgi:hypothetical protein